MGALLGLIRQRPVAHGVTAVYMHRVRDPLRRWTFGWFGSEDRRARRFSEDFQIHSERFRFDVPFLADPATVDFPLACESGDIVAAESEIGRGFAR